MAKDSNQRKQQKPQSSQGKRVTINESTKKSVDVDSVGRSRKGTAGDTTGSTGPRKKE